MRDSAGFLEEEIWQDELGACSTLLACSDDNFGMLVAVTGMNPATDFICADLKGCDFSNSDLRGFNFSGADLTGVIVKNARWDETTNFSGADLSGTPFTFDQGQLEFFADNPKWDRMARSLATADWMEVELWLGKDRPDHETDAASRVAFQIFRNTKNAYVKSVILLHSRYQFQSQQEYRDFMLAELARPHDPAFAVSCVNILGRLFAHHPPVAALCHSMLTDTNERVRRAAVFALLNGIRGAHLPESIAAWLKTEPSGEIRRYVVARLVRRMSSLHETIARQSAKPGYYRDFKTPISEATIFRLAEYWISNDAAKDVLLDDVQAKLPPLIKAKSTAAEEHFAQQRRRQLVRQIFEDFKRAGVPFVLEPRHVPTADTLALVKTSHSPDVG